MWPTWFCIMLTAQDPAILTLNQALYEAVQAQPLLQASRQRSASAHAQRKGIGSLQYPSLNFSAQILEGSNNASSADFIGVEDFPRIAGISTSTGIPTGEHPDYAARTNMLVGFGAHYRVFDFGYTRGRVHAADADSEAADNFEAQALQDVLLRVSQAYLQTVAAQQSLDVAKDTQQRAQQHHNLAAAGVQGGMRPRIDLARSDAELAAANLGVIRAQNSLIIMRSSLDTAIGWVPHDYAVVAPDAPDVHPPTVEDIHAMAMQERPDLRGYKAQERAASFSADAAFALNFPQLTATGSANVRGVSGTTSAFNWDVGLVLSLPVFSGFAIQAQTEQAEAQRREAEANRHVLEYTIQYQLSQARSTLLSATEAVVASDAAVVGAKAALEQAESRYKEGLGNIVELTDAQTQYDVAQQGLVQSKLSQALSAVQLRYVYGGLRVAEVPSGDAHGN